MSSQNGKRLLPRNGHTLHAGLGARISGCANQKELSLDDQDDSLLPSFERFDSDGERSMA
jgi:site-specific DNA recombinase